MRNSGETQRETHNKKIKHKLHKANYRANNHCTQQNGKRREINRTLLRQRNNIRVTIHLLTSLTFKRLTKTINAIIPAAKQKQKQKKHNTRNEKANYRPNNITEKESGYVEQQHLRIIIFGVWFARDNYRCRNWPRYGEERKCEGDGGKETEAEPKKKSQSNISTKQITDQTTFLEQILYGNSPKLQCQFMHCVSIDTNYGNQTKCNTLLTDIRNENANEQTTTEHNNKKANYRANKNRPQQQQRNDKTKAKKQTSRTTACVWSSIAEFCRLLADQLCLHAHPHPCVWVCACVSMCIECVRLLFWIISSELSITRLFWLVCWAQRQSLTGSCSQNHKDTINTKTIQKSPHNNTKHNKNHKQHNQRNKQTRTVCRQTESSSFCHATTALVDFLRPLLLMACHPPVCVCVFSGFSL